MQLRSSLPLICLVCLVIFTNCSKDDDPDPSGKSKTELLTQASWRYDKIEPAIAESYVPSCLKDNTITFLPDGHGTSPDTGEVCSPAISSPFDWNFLENETRLHMDAAIVPAGGSQDFDVVSLNETNLVVSQNITSPFPTTITVTFKH